MVNSKVIIGTCAYNEGVKLEQTIERIRVFIESQKAELIDYQILVHDDCSTDGTPQKLAEKGDIWLFRNEKRQGVGACMREHMGAALEKGYDAITYIAGNTKDNPSEIPRVINPIINNEMDFVQGSRYARGGRAGNTPFYRQIATKFVHPILFSLFVGRRLTDTTNGFRAIRLSMLKNPNINLDQDWLDKYELEPYLYFKAIKLGYRVSEAPVSKIYPPRHLGYTKMKPITGWWSILRPIFLLGFGLKK